MDGYVRTGNPAYLERAVVRARTLLRLAIRDGGSLLFPYRWNYPAEGLKAPWVSSYAQGFALSLFVRLYRVTGEPAYLAAARSTFLSFRRLGPSRARWVAYATGGSLWLEEYPSSRPTHVLNGFDFAVFGIYDYERLTRDPTARRMLRAALATLRGNAGRYRVAGGISYYDLLHRTRSLHYHEIHVWQLAALGRISGDPYFGRLSRALAADVR